MAIAKLMAVLHKPMTEEEFMRLPDDGYKYELVDGAAKRAPANFQHDVIGATVIALLRQHTKGLGFVTGSQAGFRMVNKNIRCPDISFTRKSRVNGGLPGDWFGEVAPDLCIEIISKSEDIADAQRKVREYFEAGAQQVWHMFPERQEIKVFASTDVSHTYRADEEISIGDLIPGFRHQVAELFELE